MIIITIVSNTDGTDLINTLTLYILTVLIWGSTWLAITFQLGEVDPLVSIGYRFALASLLLLAFVSFTRKQLRFPLHAHGFIFLQGASLFGFNYWLFYLVSNDLASGIVSVTFSTVILMNAFNGRLFLGKKIRPYVIFAAIIGLCGIVLVFLPEVESFPAESQALKTLGMAILATYLASLGNILSVRIQLEKIPVLQSNAIGMGYGALLMLLIAILMGKPFSFDWSPGYIGSLVYLTIFGSIVAFGCYLTLIGRIGADKAAYASLLFPVVALQLSVWFEGYQWNQLSLIGTAMILLGNLIILLPDSVVKQLLKNLKFGKRASTEELDYSKD